MGVARGPGEPLSPEAQEHADRLGRYKCLLQAGVVAYVLFYAILYKNTHLQKEKVTGAVDVGAWPNEKAKDSSQFVSLPYCGAAAYRLEEGCSTVAQSSLRDENYGQPRFELGTEHAGEVVCCELDGSSSTRKIGGQCISGTAGKSGKYSFYEAKAECEDHGMRLCYTSEELDLSCDGGCSHDEALVWTSQQDPSTSGQSLRCVFVNELDVLSFDVEYTFLPTHATVVHQKASCADGQSDTSWCKLDYKTDEESMKTLDEYWIGGVEDFQMSLAHTFHSEMVGDGTMFDAEREDVPFCDDTVDAGPICRDTASGGHDRVSVRGLLGMLGIDLESNNDASDHPNHIEAFRNSGIKILINVHYSNLPARWWRRSDARLRYEYKVHVVPAEGVWHGLTLDPRREARAWVSMGQLGGIAADDRVLVWADGIEIRTRLTGELGHLEPQALLLTVASALPLLFFARNIVELLCGQWQPHRAEESGESSSVAGGSSLLRAEAGCMPSKGHEGNDGL